MSDDKPIDWKAVGINLEPWQREVADRLMRGDRLELRPFHRRSAPLDAHIFAAQIEACRLGESLNLLTPTEHITVHPNLRVERIPRADDDR